MRICSSHLKRFSRADMGISLEFKLPCSALMRAQCPELSAVSPQVLPLRNSVCLGTHRLIYVVV